MPSINIGRVHSLAIVREIGERLAPMLPEEKDLPLNLQRQLQRLAALEDAPPLAPERDELLRGEKQEALGEPASRFASWFRRKR
ncbi:hypothetical protein XH88_02430 [Bradyrhizobium sp. CCBAU 51627]|nr:hypothetical protein [Bradyrhizobium sp. CCBAU 51627]